MTRVAHASWLYVLGVLSYGITTSTLSLLSAAPCYTYMYIEVFLATTIGI